MAYAQTLRDVSEEKRPLITVRAVVLGVATGVLLNTYTNYTGMVLVNSALVKSQLPMSMLLPFVGWIGVNLVLRFFWPRIALSSSELVLIYSMSWIVGTIPVGMGYVLGRYCQFPDLLCLAGKPMGGVSFRRYALVGIAPGVGGVYNDLLRGSAAGREHSLDQLDRRAWLVVQLVYRACGGCALCLGYFSEAVGRCRKADFSSGDFSRRADRGF